MNIKHLYQRFSVCEDMTRKEPFCMANKEKLLALQSKIKENKVTKKHSRDIVCVHVGIELTPYFPKVKNADGTNAKDEDGERQTF